MNPLLTISLRQKAIYIPSAEIIAPSDSLPMSESTMVFVAQLTQMGFSVSEPLLRKLNQTSASYQAEILTQFKTILGIGLNWTPLVKDWNVPTGESYLDHLLTLCLILRVFGNHFTLWAPHSASHFSARALQRLPLLWYTVCLRAASTSQSHSAAHKRAEKSSRLLE
jgi:hypothetical protein